jgi:hypothetical protein
MKMGTIISPWRYDAAARDALQSTNLRQPAILHYASGPGALPNIATWSAYPLIAAVPINTKTAA